MITHPDGTVTLTEAERAQIAGPMLAQLRLRVPSMTDEQAEDRWPSLVALAEDLVARTLAGQKYGQDYVLTLRPADQDQQAA
ncbi:MAG: hypothetical protein HOV96_19390 [Nonomuraea sp.]|nr:hypothetical protein [Nonomuraea sp.]